MVRIILASLLLVPALGVRAEERDVLRRLMAEPVTLLDWGLAQLNRDIARVARQTQVHRIGRGDATTGTIYDWRSNRVTVYLTVSLPRGERTPPACAAMFRNIVASLTDGAPKGPDAAGWYLLNAFQPSSHFWANRFEDVGAKLVEVVDLEISLLPSTAEAINGDTKRVRCTGPLDAAREDLSFETVP